MKKHTIFTQSQAGFAHALLVALIVVIGVASFGTYRIVSSSATVKQNTVSLYTQDGCWLAGRVWDASSAKANKCTAKCRNTAAELKKNGPDGAYCSGHVWLMDDARRCALELHRYYIAEVDGCARKPSQNDGIDQRYCAAGYPYYNADYNNRDEGASGKIDVCEASKKAAVRNENKGTPGQSAPASSGATASNNGTPSNNTSGNNDNSSKPVKKATIRVGAYNAWSVTKTDNNDQVRRLYVGMSKMRDGGAEIVSLQEFSQAQTNALSKHPYWAVYRSNMSGNRGLGIAYKRDAFKVIDSGDFVIPRNGMDQREPILTLERKADKARITVMGVHLVAFTYGRQNYETYQVKQQKVVKDKASSLASQGKTVVVAGDFNWDFAKRKGYMAPFQYKGIRYTNFLAPADQKLSNFKDIDAGIASDHRLIFVDAETTIAE